MIDETALERRLVEEAHSAYRWSNSAGTSYEPHRHAYRKILYCLRGSISFHLVDQRRSIQMKPGDRLELAPGSIHSAEVGPSGVTCVEGQARDPEA